MGNTGLLRLSSFSQSLLFSLTLPSPNSPIPCFTSSLHLSLFPHLLWLPLSFSTLHEHPSCPQSASISQLLSALPSLHLPLCHCYLSIPPSINSGGYLLSSSPSPVPHSLPTSLLLSFLFLISLTQSPPPVCLQVPSPRKFLLDLKQSLPLLSHTHAHTRTHTHTHTHTHIHSVVQMVEWRYGVLLISIAYECPGCSHQGVLSTTASY